LKLKELTQEKLKEHVSYDKLTGKLHWIKPTSSCIKVGDEVGSLDGDRGYVICQILGVRTYRHRFIWFYEHGYWPNQVDHKNRIKGEDKLDNLQESNSFKNSINVNRNNFSSIYPGVGFHKSSGKWRARTRVQGKRIEIGRFNTENEAKIAYEKYNSDRL